MGDFSNKFATDLLAQLGYPATPENIKFLTAWAQAEGGTAAYNPFNTTQGSPGSSNYNSVGVKNYSNYAAGLAATVQTLKNGNYAPILSGLASGASAMTTAQGLANTPWGTGDLVVKVLGGKVTGPLGSGSTSTASVTAGAGTQTDQATIDQDFPEIAGLLDSTPELKTWAQNLISQDVDLTTAQGKNIAQQTLQQTQWYQTQSSATRSWEELQKTDPATANEQLLKAESDLTQQAHQMGVDMAPARAKYLATLQMQYGYDPTQLTTILGSYLKAQNPALYTGQAGTDLNAIQQTAGNYGITLSNQAAQSWVSQIGAGMNTAAGFENYAKQQAKLIYPGLSSQIDQGITVRQLADSYVNSEASLLELDPQSLDITKDPMIKQALQYRPPVAGTAVKPGQTVAQPAPSAALGTMPLYQFEQQVKADPRWLNTQNAKQSALSTVSQIGQSWGFST